MPTDNSWDFGKRYQQSRVTPYEKRAERDVKPADKESLNRLLREEGMDLLIYFRKKEEAYVCNYRGEIVFKMKTDPKELVKEVQRRNRE